MTTTKTAKAATNSQSARAAKDAVDPLVTIRAVDERATPGACTLPCVPVAVIDIGTNTTRLLVAEVEDGQVVELDRRTLITGLGQSVDSSGRLAQEAMDRVAEAIAVYREVIDRVGTERVVALATSAMRDAENGPEFRDYLKQ